MDQPPTSSSVVQVDAEQTRAYIANVSATPQMMDREPRVVARWIGDSRSKVTCGDATLYLGGNGDLNPMQALLGAFAACDVDLVAMHAALLGVDIEELWIEATGPFHVARYLGLDSAQSPGYRHIDYTVHLRVRKASDEQIERLRQLCETGSPVGETLNRPVPTRLMLDVHTSDRTTRRPGETVTPQRHQPLSLVKIRHLGLPVRDYRRSLHFYTTYFGFDPATAQEYSDGTMIVRNAERFDLALHPSSEAPPSATFLHFGFTMPDAAAVHALRTRMEDDGVPIVERDDEPDLVSFKCLDPDGWRIEVYWEP